MKKKKTYPPITKWETQRLMEEFLANGGKIKLIKPNKSGKRKK